MAEEVSEGWGREPMGRLARADLESWRDSAPATPAAPAAPAAPGAVAKADTGTPALAAGDASVNASVNASVADQLREIHSR